MRLSRHTTTSAMTCKPALRTHTHSGVAILIATLTILIALLALAPTTGAGQPSARLSAAFLLQDAPSVSSRPLFRPAITYPVSFDQAGSVAVADVNGDGKPDLLVAVPCPQLDCEGEVDVMLGNGDGTFQPVVVFGSGGAFPQWIAVGDLNGDGKPDVVVVNCAAVGSGHGCSGSGADGLVAVLLGNGDGTFRRAAVTYDSGGVQPDSVAIADVNGDGKPDLVVANCAPTGTDNCGGGPANGVVGVLLGNGDGTYQPVMTYDSGGELTTSAAIADVNGDGKMDVLVTNECAGTGCNSGSVSVLLGNGDGTYQAAKGYNSGPGGAHSVAVADVNHDGKPDLVLADLCEQGDCTQGSVGVLLGNGDGSFQPVVSYASGGYQARSIAVADVNLDGKLDLLVANSCIIGGCPKGEVGVLLGNGNGTFQTVRTYGSGGTDVSSIAVADVNGDGRPDLLVGNGVVSVLWNVTAAHLTRTVVTTSGSPSILGQPVKFTATVNSSFGIPDGETVTFHDGIALIGTGTTVLGVASFSTSSLMVGSHTIEAIYPGDFADRPSTGNVKQVVELYTTTTTLTSTPNPSTHGQAVTFTATVTSSGPNPPTGKVTFKDGTTGIGSATLSGGVAILKKSTLAVGTHPITAEYMGDSSSAKSTSAVLNQVVN
jgi:Bacterial Ig-like domain (group 3)/FG-GAP-like repeat